MATQAAFSDSELTSPRHPSETSRFMLALFTAIPVAIGLLAMIIVTKGAVLAVILVAVPSVWFWLQMVKASLVASSVRVSPDNFPEVHQVLVEVQQRLNYTKKVDIYVTDGGSFNAFLYKFGSSGRDRAPARATLGESLAVSAFPRYVPV